VGWLGQALPEPIWRPLVGLWESFLAQAPNLIAGLVVFVAFWFAARLLGWAMRLVGSRTRLDRRLALLFGRLASAATIILGLLVAAVVIFPTFRPGDLIAGLGITSVAIGFAFKDVLQNFFAGVLLLWRQPFRTGDQIRVLDYEGTVEEINIRSTRLRTYDGERAVLPNGDVYTSAILVRTAYAARRVQVSVGVGYADPIDRARATIVRALRDTTGVLAAPEPDAYVSELGASSVVFAAFFWVEPRQENVLRVRDRAAASIKRALDEAGIDMPYPHTVVLFRDQTDGHLRPPDRRRAAPGGEARRGRTP
jgi:small-conductance mechanosensitive channel